MFTSMIATKLVVRDVEAAERFYVALGMKVVSRNTGGEKEVHQQQSWVSASGDMTTHVIILSRFLELPAPVPPPYPGHAWLAVSVTDVDSTIRAAEQAGGKCVRPGENRPEHSVRAGLISDLDGHITELVGPMKAD